MPVNTCVPAIAINRDGAAKTWMAVWNNGNELRFTMQYGPGTTPPLVSNLLFIDEGSVLPQYPSIVWGSPENDPDGDYEFHVVWRSDPSVRFALIGVQETAGIPDIDGNTWSQASGTASVEIVHDGSGIYQPFPLVAVHAPSVTADTGHVIIANTPSQTDLGLWTFAAYEVEEPTQTGGGSKWPSTSFVVSPLRLMSRASKGIFSTSLPSTLTPTILRVNTRISQMWNPGPGLTVLPWSFVLAEYRSTPTQKVPLNPCIGIMKNPGPPFPWSSGYYYTPYLVRTLFQEVSFQVSVAKEILNVTGSPPNIPTVTFHAEGLDPNQPDVTTSSTIRSLYCDNSPSNELVWQLQNLQNSALTKSAVIVEPIEMRQLRYTADSSVATIGLCNPRLVNGGGTATAIGWKPMLDSTGLAEEFPIALRMRSEIFDISGYDSLYYERELLTFNRAGFEDQEFRIQLRDAETDEVSLTAAIRCRNMPEDSTYYELTGIDLSSLSGQNYYITLDISEDMDSSDVEVVHISANLIIDEEMQKLLRPTAPPSSITLNQNIPNPFNPSTEITYGIPDETHVKLAVYDQLGREVKVLANGWKAPGTYTVTFDAAELPSGMYLYRIETGKGSISKKMVLMK